MHTRARWRSALPTAVATSFALVLAALVPVATATAATAATDAAQPTTVSSDAMPTVQVDGVVWTQLVVGSTVYVGGSFTTATPAGGTAASAVARSNMLAYDLTTGALITTFAPTFDAQVRGLAASPDGKRIYAVGDFTTVNGVAKNRLVALDATTGARVTTFAAKTNSAAWTVVATATTVYVGGAFTTANDVTRSRAAAFSATDGSLLAWAPAVADNVLRAMVISPDASRLVLGGSFTAVNGTAGTAGVAAVDATSGASVAWAAGSRITNHGTKSAITSLTSDGTNVYGTGYVYGALTDGTLEGTFNASWNGGTINWVEDCHGDTYSSGVLDGVVYTASHAHYCGNVPGGFDQNSASSSASTHQRGLAFSVAATGTLLSNTYGSSSTYADFGGTAAPTMLTWYPTLTAGTVTGQDQAAWSVATAPGYVLLAGEFPKVNGTAQAGLVRFRVRSAASNTDGPQVYGTGWPLTTTGVASGAVRLAWQANYDRDDTQLTYKIYRDGAATPFATTTAVSRGWWYRPWLSFTDTGLQAGSTHTYKVKAVDPSGNTANTSTVTATAGTGAIGSSSGAYASAVLTDAPSSYWRFDEPSGSTSVLDRSGGADLTAGTGVSLGTGGALSGDADTAATFSGTSAGLAATSTPQDGPTSFTIETWFRTTSTAGGKLVGFGSSASGTSSSYDRHLYLDTSGRILFGVYPNAIRTVQSGTGYNDGAWHHVVASLGSGGMRLYVDGAPVASRTDVTQGQSYRGYWRVGGDSSWSGASWFTGSIDDVAIYPTALTDAQVANHYRIGTTGAGNTAPTAAATVSTNGLTAVFDGSGSADADGSVASYSWAFGDGSTGTGATATHVYAARGTYTATLTVTDSGGLTATTTKQVTVAPPNTAPTASASLTAAGLTLTADGRGSTDQDGSVASYAWTFGDGTTATGATATHTYAASGTYPVTLTVTDDSGATATTALSAAVSDPRLALDGFGRTVSGGLGTADLGSAWTVGTGASAFSVGGAAASFSTAAGTTRSAYLNQVSSASDDVLVTVAVPALPVGGSAFAGVVGRRVGTDDYNARIVIAADGSTKLEVLHGTTALKSVSLGVTATAGSSFRLRLRTTGSGTTTLQARAWLASGTEPTSWQATATDATAALQAAGSVGLRSYVGSGVTSGPVAITFDDVEVDAL